MFKRIALLTAALGLLAPMALTSGCDVGDDPEEDLDSIEGCRSVYSHRFCFGGKPILNGQLPEIHWDFTYWRAQVWNRPIRDDGFWRAMFSEPNGDVEIEYLAKWGLDPRQTTKIGGKLFIGGADIWEQWQTGAVPVVHPRIPDLYVRDHIKSGKLATLNVFGNSIQLLAGDPKLLGTFTKSQRKLFPLIQGAYAVKEVYFDGDNAPMDYGVVCAGPEFEMEIAAAVGSQEVRQFFRRLMDREAAIAATGRSVFEYAGTCDKLCKVETDGTYAFCRFPVIGTVSYPVTVAISQESLDLYVDKWPF